jgi:16S rRNA (adenine1518-N6/adenine1519-N6)-dimethyltransferase
VLEIGPGLGALTLALLDTGAAVTAVEIDRYLLPALEETVGERGARVIHADAMTLDWSTVLGDDDWTVVANLPYNVATPLLADLLDFVPQVKRMLVMVQKEVAERLAATPRTPAYGAVSVKIAYWATARVVGTVPASVFLPQPKVESGLVEIERRPIPAIDPHVVTHEQLFMLVRTGFGHRRQMLRRTLSSLVSADAFAAAGVNPQARPEELDVFAWGRLAEAALEMPVNPAAAPD